jgi:hypothetical protein
MRLTAFLLCAVIVISIAGLYIYANYAPSNAPADADTAPTADASAHTTPDADDLAAPSRRPAWWTVTQPSPGEKAGLEGRKFKFQDCLSGPLPFTYEPPVEPHVLAQMLASKIDFGEYAIDHDTPLTAENRTPAANAPDLGDLRWHSKKRSYANLLGALADTLPAALQKPTPPYGVFNTARMIAVTEDARAAAGLAEVALRLAPPKHLPAALDHLAGAYWLAHEYDRIDALLRAGADYRPTAEHGCGLPAELRSLLQQAAPAPDDHTRLQLALVRGDAADAEVALARVDDANLRQACKPLVARHRHGLLTELDNKHRAAVTARLADLRRQLEGVRLPLHDRFADWPIPRLEDHLRWTTRALGGYSDPAADCLGYLIEQRRYTGLNVASGTALCAGKRFERRREPFRALPMYLLCQKLGYLHEDARFDEDGPDAMVSFNGFEAPIYFARAIVGCHRLWKYVKAHGEIYDIAMRMYDYSLEHCLDPNIAGIAGRCGYHEIALSFKWPLSLLTGHAEDAVPELEQTIRNGATPMLRSKAAGCLGRYYLVHAEEYEKAADIFHRLAVGEVSGYPTFYGLSMLLRVAKRVPAEHRPRLLARCVDVANAMIANADDDNVAASFVRRVSDLRDRIEKRLTALHKTAVVEQSEEI